MSFKQLIFRNLKKNIANYYLYVFALVFSVALYFAFVTLQYDPSMDEMEGSIKGAAAIKVGSVMLIAIITVFLIYANNLFIKRRSKEIGLLQLVGLPKKKIFQILTIENIIIYFGSMIIGILLGFASSKLLMMVLMKTMGFDEVVTLRFSNEALIQTIIVFGFIYLIIMAMNASFIRRQRILHLFQSTSKSEDKVRRISKLEIMIGVIGIGFISFGYYLSTKLFSGDFVGMEALFVVMMTILFTVIVGTYLFYKGSVSFIFNIIRKKSNGYLSIQKVLSLSSIMFRMKSNALLLTVITTVSALAIGLLSLSYISYYSAEKNAKEMFPNHFSIPNEAEAEMFLDELKKAKIEYEVTEIPFHIIHANLSDVIKLKMKSNDYFDPEEVTIAVIGDKKIKGVEVGANEIIFENYSEALQKYMALNDSGEVTIKGKSKIFDLSFKGVGDQFILPSHLTMGGFTVAVVNQEIYDALEADIDEEIQEDFQIYVGIDIKNNQELDKADEIFVEMGFLEKGFGYGSQLFLFNASKISMGLIMFIVGFLGLTFLISSGCILYFKQMGESEEEKGTYTILRKLGFTNNDLMKGVRVKQLFNFGIPLVIGLSHSYFAVKSGWFFFGTELWTPMLIVMGLYTILYSIFGILSVLYYRKVIKESL